MKTVMVLGAGQFQLAGIQSLADRGLQVITVDNVPGNAGHRLADRSLNISTTDIPALVDAARRHEIDAAVTFASDRAVHAVAAICGALGLPGPSVAAARKLCDKAEARLMQRTAGLPHPDFRVVEPGKFDVAELPQSPGPWIVKPVDNSGSRGVERVDDPGHLERAVARAAGHSATGRVCIESFLPGVEAGGDAYLDRGSILWSAVTNKFRQGFYVRGHSLPSGLSPGQIQAINAAVEQLARAAGYATGPVNFDVMVDGDTATVIEMSPRTGGNGIPSLIRLSSGIDPYEYAIAAALGNPVPQPTGQEAVAAGSAVLCSGASGSVESIRPATEIRQAVPEIEELVIGIDPGDTVSAFSRSGQAIGYCTFLIPAGSDYEQLAEQIQRATDLIVKPDPNGVA